MSATHFAIISILGICAYGGAAGVRPAEVEPPPVVQPAAASRLTGVWLLNIPSSDLGVDRPEAAYSFRRTLKVTGTVLTQYDEQRNVNGFGGRKPLVTSSVAFQLDGSEHALEGMTRLSIPGKTVGAASWQGDNLLIAGRGQDFIGPWSFSNLYFLTSNGKRLTVLESQTMTFGVLYRKLIFDRVK